MRARLHAAEQQNGHERDRGGIRARLRNARGACCTSHRRLYFRRLLRSALNAAVRESLLSTHWTRLAMRAQYLVGKGFDSFMSIGPWLLAADGWRTERELSLS